MKRWIPKKGERVTLLGDKALARWTGTVLSVSKDGCERGQVYLEIAGFGFTFAEREEIVLHQ